MDVSRATSVPPSGASPTKNPRLPPWRLAVCRTVLASATLIVLVSAVPAAEVRRAEDATVSGRLIGIENGKLLVRPADAPAPTAVPLDDVVEVTLTDPPPPTTGPTTRQALPPTPRATANAPTTAPTAPTATAGAVTRPAAGGRRWTLKLTSPDTLTLSGVAWTGGRVSGTLAGTLAVDLPVTGVAELWCGTGDQVAAARALGETAATDDVAYAVRDGKLIAVHGVAEGLAGDALRFKFGEQTRTIALARLVGVAFAKPAAGPAAADPAAVAAQQAVTLDGGDSLPGRWTGVDDTRLTFVAAWGQELIVPRREAKGVAFRNGRVRSLSDFRPSDVSQTPYFDRVLPWTIDRALDGQPLRLSDGPVARGLAVHARTALTFPLDGAFAQFRSHVGFEQPGGRLGDAVVRVLGDGRVLFEKSDARGTDPPIDVSVNVEGVRRLTLEVDFGRGQDVGDRVVWGNARVLRPPTPRGGTTP